MNQHHFLYKEKNRVRRLSRIAILFALSLALSYFESFLPPIGGPFPLRYGLANIPLMYAILKEGLPTGITLSLFKASFALATRGTMAGALSLSGGLFSVIIMYSVNKLSKGKVSYLLFSVLGAVTHNITQLAVILIIFPGSAGNALFALTPYLIVLGIASGIITAFILQLLLNRLNSSH